MEINLLDADLNGTVSPSCGGQKVEKPPQLLLKCIQPSRVVHLLSATFVESLGRSGGNKGAGYASIRV